jgi:hypothetical protein
VKKLLDAVTANGNSSSYKWPGGKGTLVAAGTWGSGTITLQASPDSGTTWVSSSVTRTADGISAFDLPPCLIRLALTGATNPSLNAWVGGNDLA